MSLSVRPHYGVSLNKLILQLLGFWAAIGMFSLSFGGCFFGGGIYCRWSEFEHFFILFLAVSESLRK